MAKIFIVDDEKSIRKTFEAFLRNEGHNVTTSSDAEEALRQVKTSAPDMVITDIIMPKIDGMTFLRQVKDVLPDTPVVIMTGEPTVETARLSVTHNAFDYLTKPVNKQVLLRVVKNALDHRALLESKKQLEKENKAYRDNLEELVAQRTESLQNTIQATLHTIMSLVELRDQYTAGHQRRVGNLAAEIAKKMGLDAAVVDGLYVTGYLHDIGKISVPAEILTKPGRLSDIEFEVIKTHVRYGYDVLSKATLPWPVADIVNQHHERSDGSGYPNGLVGSEIRIEAMIVAVADVIEAMTSHRPYRPSLGTDAALEEIADGCGKRYDEAVASAAISLFRNDGYEFCDDIMHSLGISGYEL